MSSMPLQRCSPQPVWNKRLDAFEVFILLAGIYSTNQSTASSSSKCALLHSPLLPYQRSLLLLRSCKAQIVFSVLSLPPVAELRCAPPPLPSLFTGELSLLVRILCLLPPSRTRCKLPRCMSFIRSKTN